MRHLLYCLTALHNKHGSLAIIFVHTLGRATVSSTFYLDILVIFRCFRSHASIFYKNIPMYERSPLLYTWKI